jgi:hypothetical protein
MVTCGSELEEDIGGDDVDEEMAELEKSEDAICCLPYRS